MRSGDTQGPAPAYLLRLVDAALPAGERRRRERRKGERRGRAERPLADRRRGPERRYTVQRRESATGHLLNALQILTLAVADPVPAPGVLESVRLRVLLGLLEMRRGHLGTMAGGSGLP